MRQRFFTSILLFAALFVVGSATRAAAQVGRVGGVVKEESGQPLKGGAPYVQWPEQPREIAASVTAEPGLRLAHSHA